MKKIILVFKNELLNTIRRKSFLLTLILIPLGGFILTFIIGGSQKTSSPNVLTEIFSSPSRSSVYGIYDGSHMITDLPAEDRDTFRLFNSEDSALQALQNGEIDAYYSIDSDYVSTGKIILRKTELDLMGNDPSNEIKTMLDKALLKNDPATLKRVITPLVVTTDIQSAEPQKDPESMLTFYIPYVVTMLFYIVILTSASLMLSSITNEKSNRVMEILMTSITPLQMLTGKIVALGLVGLIQTIVWSGAGLLLLRISGRTLNLDSSVQLPASILIFGILFFLSGYFLYASLMAGAGALVPNMKEASQATTILVIPLVIPLILISAIVNDPNGTLATIFSLFPLTAPVTMMTRLAAGPVPGWQIGLSLLLIVLTAYLVIRSVANFFRAQTLLSGKEFKRKYFFQALFGRL